PGLTLFNAFYRTMKGRAPGPHSARCQSFFFPLDAVEDWNLLYGPAGLHQHQSVVPVDAARRIVPLLLSAARESGQASFLTVLKRFGDIGSPGLLSFPRGGFTLTLDFPNRGERTLGLLSRLDAITMDAGGAVNPYKDSRMPADVFRQSFPRWAELERVRDPAFISDFWHRVGTVPAQLMAAE
ncbi:MAG: FAD-binding protein, partial [Rhizobiaceae bacterium]